MDVVNIILLSNMLSCQISDVKLDTILIGTKCSDLGLIGSYFWEQCSVALWKVDMQPL